MLFENPNPPTQNKMVLYLWSAINASVLTLELIMYYYGYWTKFFSDSYGFTQAIMVIGHFSVFMTYFPARWMTKIEEKWFKIVSSNALQNRRQLDEAFDLIYNSFMLRTFWVRRMSNMMVVFGLAGTVLGIILSVPYDVLDIDLSNTSEIMKFLEQLFAGISVMFLTTLAGIFFYLWTQIHILILDWEWSRFVSTTLKKFHV